MLAADLFELLSDALVGEPLIAMRREADWLFDFGGACTVRCEGEWTLTTPTERLSSETTSHADVEQATDRCVVESAEVDRSTAALRIELSGGHEIQMWDASGFEMWIASFRGRGAAFEVFASNGSVSWSAQTLAALPAVTVVYSLSLKSGSSRPSGYILYGGRRLRLLDRLRIAWVKLNQPRTAQPSKSE